ncbi:MAG: MauE/DoxX family redox-associated membrane protein [Bacteroidota bacterium]
MKRIFFIILSVILGLVFIFSAYAKLFPVELFELTLIDTGVSNWFLAPLLARFFIGLEFFIGFMLISNIYMNRNILKLTIAIIIIFTIYLIILIFIEGNEGNCKCFGNLISLTPFESIIKNILILLLSFLLYVKHAGFSWKFSKVFLSLILIVSIPLPFILNPVDLNASERNLNEEKLNYDLGLEILYNNPKVVQPKENLRTGKHIIAFISLNCPHCRIGAYKMHIIKKRNSEIPIFFVLNGVEEDLQTFFDETKTSNIPYTILLGPEFVKRSGVKLPAIFWVEDGIVVRKTKYVYLEQKDIEEWIEN